eukprot:gene11495-12688_t
MNIKAWSKSLKVQFVGESPVDDGGPEQIQAFVKSLQDVETEASLQEICNEKLCWMLASPRQDYLWKIKKASLKLSDSGSNRRNLEEELLMNFTHFLEDLEGDVVTAELLYPEDDSLSKIVLHLDDFLQCVTGSPKVPCLRFSTTPSIIFNHVDTKRKIPCPLARCSCVFR